MSFLAICLLGACERTEGEGGSSTIRGKIFVQDFDNDGDLKTEYYGGERDVFIVYGDSDFYDDKVDTHYDGSFQFEYLRPGNYQIYAYSECNDCPIPKFPVIVDTMIVADDEVVDLGDITVIE